MIRLSQLYVTDNRLDGNAHASILFNDNTVILLSGSSEEIVFDLVYVPDGNDTTPYMLSYIKIPEDKPLERFLKPINLEYIYEHTSNVLELQEFVLDPLYVTECSIEPVKPILTKSFIAPNMLSNNEKLLAVLNSFGACFLICKQAYTNKWTKRVCNVTEYVLNKVFPNEINRAKIRNFKDLKAMISKRHITCIAWDLVKAEHILFIGMASGDIVAVQYNEDAKELKSYVQLLTDMGTLVFMKIERDLLFVASETGTIQLFKIVRKDVAKLERITCLWSKPDSISCHLCEIMEYESLNAYVVAFCKSATLLVCIINSEGKVVAKNKIYIDDIKITGLVSLKAHEYILSTLVGNMYRIQLALSAGNFNMHKTLIPSDVDSTNFQILGLASSRNRNLFTLMLHRNKEYSKIVKNQKSSIIMETYTLATADALQQLVELDIKTMDAYKDYAVKIRLDVLNNNTNAFKYIQFSTSLNDTKYCAFNDQNLKLLQIKFIILKALCQYENTKYYGVRKQTLFEFELLKYCIEVTHIICRFAWLSKYEFLSEFQQLSALCMRRRFDLINQLIAQLIQDKEFCDMDLSIEADSLDEQSKLKNYATSFAEGAFIEMERLTACINFMNVIEKCMQCNEIIDQSMICVKGHKQQRCSISLLQVPYFKQRYCFNCKIPAIFNESNLKELFSAQEHVKCTFCRFSLTAKEL